jgi:hypothetical protein
MLGAFLLVDKNKQIALRISVEEHDIVKELGGNLTEIWRLGFEKWCQEYPEILQRRASEYQKLYSTCIAKMGKCYTNAIQKNSVFEDIYQIYISTGRDVNHPTPEDLSWIKGKLGKAGNGNRIAVTKILDYMQKRFNQDKQQKLEVKE